MYWSTWGSYENQGLIEYAYMDGTHKQTLADGSQQVMTLPSSLTIDYAGNKLYWCDPRTALIERIGLDGKDREVLARKVSEFDQFLPFSVAYHNQYIFWTDNSMGNISRMHINSTKQP